MKHLLATLCSLLLAATALAGEIVTTQNFNDLTLAGDLKFSNSNKTGTTDFVTYTCSGGTAKFNTYGTGSLIHICLTGSEAMVTTSAIEDLKKVAFRYTGSISGLKFEYLPEGGTWTVLAADASSISGMQVYVLPSTGKYQLRLTRGADLYIPSVVYTTAEPCNCLRVQLEDN